jgi:hypothetical protein
MRTVFLCHARQDSPLAHEVAQFLVRGADVRFFIEDGMLDSSAELMDKIREGQTADVILVLLSPASSPTKWNREQWQPVLFDEPAAASIPVGVVLVSECSFPALLRRKNFFDFAAAPLSAKRELRRWLIGMEAERTVPRGMPLLSTEPVDVENLVQQVADAPGTATATPAEAISFIRANWKDFESIHWMHCAARPFVSLAGELGAALSIQPFGELEQNLGQIREACISRRPLFVFDGITRSLFTQLSPGGRSSSIAIEPEHLRKSVGPTKLHRAAAVCAQAGFRWQLVEEIATKSGLIDESQLIALNQGGRYRMRKPSLPEEPLVLPHARAVWNRFRGWAADEEGCLEDLPDLELAIERCLARASVHETWVLSCELSRAAYLLTKKQNRLAEAFHWMDQLSHVAMRKGDRAMLEECTRETGWILETWNRPAYTAASTAESSEQLSLF